MKLLSREQAVRKGTTTDHHCIQIIILPPIVAYQIAACGYLKAYAKIAA
jgi:hypothetical protein